jgi:hypothetical protein
MFQLDEKTVLVVFLSALFTTLWLAKGDLNKVPTPVYIIVTVLIAIASTLGVVGGVSIVKLFL